LKAILLIFLLIIIPFHAFGFCFEEAGELYGISPLLLWAIAGVESNFDARALNWNPDGSYDFGLMQINSFWAEVIGMRNWLRLGDPCTNVKTGAWILSRCIESYGYTWEAVGCYNARSSEKRARYANRIYRKLIERGGGR
jgi:soluble lytic murein transglycosylase-like protein